MSKKRMVLSGLLLAALGSAAFAQRCALTAVIAGRLPAVAVELECLQPLAPLGVRIVDQGGAVALRVGTRLAVVSSGTTAGR